MFEVQKEMQKIKINNVEIVKKRKIVNRDKIYVLQHAGKYINKYSTTVLQLYFRYIKISHCDKTIGLLRKYK